MYKPRALPGSLASILFCFGSFVGGASWARSPQASDGHAWCGSSTHLMDHFQAEHRYNKSGPQQMKSTHASVAADVGEIAVIEDDGTILTQPNAFDLGNRTVTFTPNSGGYRVVGSAGGAPSTPGTRLNLGDDDTRQQTLQFAFPLGGTTFNSVFVNSDGNLTFGSGDNASADRSLGRLIGLPRVAALFQDLDPTTGGGVLVESTASAFIATWNQVPQFGLTARNTFQIRLQPDGTIVFVYGSIGSSNAVVGVSPRAGSSPIRVDMSAATGSSSSSQAPVEVFANQRRFDDLAVVQAFYRTHPDNYQFLVVFNDFGLAASTGFAFHLGIKNDIRGINIPPFDNTSVVGSAGRLESYLGMGPVSQYPADENTTFLGTNSTLDIFGQEAGHRWLARMRFNDRGALSDKLLGRESSPGAGQLSHWNFCMDSDGSDLEGNDWRDNGNGTFTTINATNRFSLLDQYAIGLVPASMVPPTFVLDFCNDSQNGGDPRSRARPPEIGVTVTANKQNVSIEQIVQAEGARVPAAGQAPTTFTMAVALVVQNGQQPASATLAKIDRFRRSWSAYFRTATEQRGTFVSTLDGGPEDPPGQEEEDDGGGGCGNVTPGALPPGGRPGAGLGSLLLAAGVALVLARRGRGFRSRIPGSL